MRILKFVLKFLGWLVVVLVLILASMITTMDKTPYKQMAYYQDWKQQIGNAKIHSSEGTGQLKIGWAKVNITPSAPTPMAGYGNRHGKLYESVHDSVYVRTMVVDNGTTQVAIVAADLLIIPPTVTRQLQEKLTDKEVPFDQVFLGATHSHNSVGGWGTGISGLFFSGRFNQQTVDDISNAIFQSIVKAKANLQNASISYAEALDSIDIRNRLVGEEGTVDPEVRSIIVKTENGQKAILSSYGAHSTVMQSKNMQLSRDYPGVLVDSLEKRYNFAMYMAGAVGSMGPVENGKDDFDEMKNQAYGVQQSILTKDSVSSPEKNANIGSMTLQLPLRQASPRLTMNLVLRSWVFKKAFGEFPVYVKAIRLGNILMVGMPCDFSGELVAELDAYAKRKGLNLMITSFNGGYIGYITNDKYFDRDLYETKTMSWYGPYNGVYLQEVITDIINKFS